MIALITRHAQNQPNCEQERLLRLAGRNYEQWHRSSSSVLTYGRLLRVIPDVFD
jgi:hypothetical protein